MHVRQIQFTVHKMWSRQVVVWPGLAWPSQQLISNTLGNSNNILAVWMDVVVRKPTCYPVICFDLTRQDRTVHKTAAKHHNCRAPIFTWYIISGTTHVRRVSGLVWREHLKRCVFGRWWWLLLNLVMVSQMTMLVSTFIESNADKHPQSVPYNARFT